MPRPSRIRKAAKSSHTSSPTGSPMETTCGTRLIEPTLTQSTSRLHLSQIRPVASDAMSSCPTATQRLQSPARPPATTTTQIEARTNHVETMFMGVSSSIRSVCQPNTISRAGSSSSSRSLALTFSIRRSRVLHLCQSTRK